MSALYTGWNDATTVRREVTWPAYVDLALARYAAEAELSVTAVIASLVSEGLTLNVERSAEDDKIDVEVPNVSRAMLWPIELDRQVEELASRSGSDPNSLIAQIVVAQLRAYDADLKGAAERAARLFGVGSAACSSRRRVPRSRPSALCA